MTLIGCGPTARVVRVSDAAFPACVEDRLTEPSEVAPSKNSTVPDGTPSSAVTAVTNAFSVTLSPAVTCFAEEAKDVRLGFRAAGGPSWDAPVPTAVTA